MAPLPTWRLPASRYIASQHPCMMDAQAGLRSMKRHHEKSLAEEESLHEHVDERGQFRRQCRPGHDCGADQARRGDRRLWCKPRAAHGMEPRVDHSPGDANEEKAPLESGADGASARKPCEKPGRHACRRNGDRWQNVRSPRSGPGASSVNGSRSHAAACALETGRQSKPFGRSLKNVGHPREKEAGLQASPRVPPARGDSGCTGHRGCNSANDCR